jgi:hypothetical protein
MAAAAADWLESLDDDQRAIAQLGPPGVDAEAEAERQRWFYTPTDHGGLTLHEQRPAQQRLAMRLVASGLSPAGYGTVATVMGLENVLDYTEGFVMTWGRERGRDPGMYYLRVFGEPGSAAPWGWRFGGHHVSLNNLVVDGRLQAATPCFLGADPATSPLLGGATLRPVGAVEDLARELVRSLDAERAARAVLIPRAPGDIVGANRTRIAEGATTLPLSDIWRGRFEDPLEQKKLDDASAAIDAATGFVDDDHAVLALTAAPKGLPGSELDAGQRELLRALLATYTGRVPDGLTAEVDDAALAQVHLAWAGSSVPGEPHYYRLQGPRLLVEYDNTQRAVNHAHSVWRDPEGDFGLDVLAEHRAAYHR